MSGTPWAFGPVTLAAVGGDATNIAIGVPHRGIIRSIKFEQISGTDVATTFNIYSREEAAPPGSDSMAGDTEYPRNMYKVLPEQSIGVGATLALFDLNYVYVNKDGTPTNPVRRLYVEVTPGGTGDKEFALSMEIESAPLTS